MRDHSRTESAARDAANLAGRVEDFGGGVGDQSPNPLLDEPDARLRPDPWRCPPSTPREWPPIPTEPPF